MKISLDDAHDALGNHLGFCHITWRMQKRVLKRDYGINWKSSSDLHPDVIFD